jgi:hypothetical protein
MPIDSASILALNDHEVGTTLATWDIADGNRIFYGSACVFCWSRSKSWNCGFFVNIANLLNYSYIYPLRLSDCSLSVGYMQMNTSKN